MTREEAGAYFKQLRLSRKLRLQDVIEGTTIPNVQYLSALEGGRYNILNSEHFPSLVQFFRLPREEIERIRPGTIVEIVAAPEVVIVVEPKQRRPLPDELQQAVEMYSTRYPDLAKPEWQDYLASFKNRSMEADTPEDWLDFYRNLVRFGVQPGQEN
ncbi:helix-turn-helix domain-containing protein [Deinococcus aquatilis]|uniref:helix-turn-helix domain-containing protein n=1 Tax=Deinococcus aquatilis TaxID=519440 RepID=UPI00036B4319|nr:hypothetical protein [Deinococcus aquatilis]